MAYETGTISSFDELLTKMSVFVTANGWQEETSGDIKLFKHNRCHVRAEAYAGQTTDYVGHPNRNSYNRPKNIVFDPSLDPFSNLIIRCILMPDTNSYEGTVWSVTHSELGSLPDFTVPSVGSYPDYIAGSYSESGVSFDWCYSGDSYAYAPSFGDYVGYTYTMNPYSGLGITYGTGSDGATNLTGRPPSSNSIYWTANGTKAMDTRYGMNTTNPFPLNYHFHAMIDPTTEFFCVLEDDSRRTETAGPLVQYMGFGEFESVAGENGFYAIACGDDTEDLLETNKYAYHTNASQLFMNNGSTIFPILPFASGEYSGHFYIYDVTIGSPWKRCGGRQGDDSSSLDRVLAVQDLAVSKGVRYGDSANSELQAPLLYPHEFYALLNPVFYANRGYPYPTMLLGAPNIIRQVKLTYTEHGEVVSDGAENWKCYAAYQREDLTPASNQVSSYLFGFALRKD